MSSSMANSDLGYLQRVKDLTHTVVPDSMSMRFRVSGFVHYMDRILQGRFRFSVGLGSDIGAWTPDTESTLVQPVAFNSEVIFLNRIPKWVAVGDIVTLGPATYHEVVSIDNEAVSLTIRETANTDLDVPHPVFLYAKRCVQVGVMPNTTTVVINSPEPILPGDELLLVTLPGVLGAYSPQTVASVTEPNPGQYEVILSAPVVDPGDEAIWYLRAHPAYISEDLIIPSSKRTLGPLYFDVASQRLVDSTRVLGERISLQMKSAGGTVLESFPDLRRNQFVSTFPIRPDSFLFGRILTGSLQYEESQRVRVIAGSLGYGSVVIDFPSTLSNPGLSWDVIVNASTDGKFRARFKGGAWQTFDLLAGQDTTATVALDVESRQLEVVWVGAEGSYCSVGEWFPSTRRAERMQYSHIVRLDGARWLSTGAIFKPALLSLADLDSVNLRTDSGLMLPE